MQSLFDEASHLDRIRMAPSLAAIYFNLTEYHNYSLSLRYMLRAIVPMREVEKLLFFSKANKRQIALVFPPTLETKAKECGLSAIEVNSQSNSWLQQVHLSLAFKARSVFEALVDDEKWKREKRSRARTGVKSVNERERVRHDRRGALHLAVRKCQRVCSHRVCGRHELCWCWSIGPGCRRVLRRLVQDELLRAAAHRPSRLREETRRDRYSSSRERRSIGALYSGRAR